MTLAMLSLVMPMLSFNGGALHQHAPSCRSCAVLSRVKMRTTIAVPTREASATGDMVQLPSLDADEEAKVRRGEMLRWQEPPGAGGEGSGFAVMELCADPDEIFRAVSAYSRYDELIPTVRTATAYEDPEAGTESDNVCRYKFIVSRVRLRLDVRFATDDEQRYACWRLDKPSWVLADSTGYWHVQPCDDRPGVTRVWFVVRVRLAARVPGFIISLVSRLGLAKATRWLPQSFGCPMT